MQQEPQPLTHSDQQSENAPPSATPPAPAPESGAARPSAHRLSPFLKISIILLATLSIASISLLFIGDFEGKIERVCSTFFTFAAFVGLTAFDTRRTQHHEWYPPVALIANAYTLALLLIIVWMSPATWSLVWNIFWKSLAVILIIRAVVWCSQLLLGRSAAQPKPLSMLSVSTSLIATLTGFLFTVPLAIDAFNIRVPDLYWRFAVSSLLLTALGVSITMLLRWAYNGDTREASKRAREAAQHTLTNSQHYPPYPAAQATNNPAATPPQPLLPWPTHPNGQPLPAGPDGQPDFSAAPR